LPDRVPFLILARAQGQDHNSVAGVCIEVHLNGASDSAGSACSTTEPGKIHKARVEALIQIIVNRVTNGFIEAALSGELHLRTFAGALIRRS
jgi:hypothetical protein